MSKSQIFAITNICKQILVTFGRIGTSSENGSLLPDLTKTVGPGSRQVLEVDQVVVGDVHFEVDRLVGGAGAAVVDPIHVAEVDCRLVVDKLWF
jgi:hypothetical protein